MKKFLLMSLLVSLNLFGYKLTNRFLLPGNYEIFYGDSLLNQVNWSFYNFLPEGDLQWWDIDSVVTHFNLNTFQVANKPTISFNSAIDLYAPCKMIYDSLKQVTTEFGTYDAFQLFKFDPDSTYGGKTNFTIYVNSEISKWQSTNDETNMKSILAHELGHAFGADDQDTYEDALMHYTFELGGVMTTLSKMPVNDDLNAFKNVYEKPSVQVLSSHVAIDDTMKVYYVNTGDSVEFQINTPQLLEYNSVIPHDLQLACFFTNLSNSEYTVSPNSLGNNTYIIKESISDLLACYGNNVLKLRTFVKRVDWDYDYYDIGGAPCGEVYFKFAPKPSIESPSPDEVYNVRKSGGKGSITDTLPIKVRVPEVLGSYPQINIKIDDVYVNQGDIIFDSEENVWVYNWDLSAETPTEYGKKYIIKAEIDGDPTDFDVTGIYLVEAIFNEDFQTMLSLTASGWTKYSWEQPELPYTGWWLDVDSLDHTNICALTQTQHSTTLTYWIKTPSITIPSGSDKKTYVTYKIFYAELEDNPPFSKLYFNIYDLLGNALTPIAQIPAVNGQWTSFTYDLSEYAGQSIKLRWHNLYSSSTTACRYTAYCLDDVLVYSLPDMEGPNIDYIAGNTADIDEDMNLTLQFNDNSDISSVTADYSIEEDGDTITLYPVKGTYNYTGTIPARDHECNGSISFKIKDSVGNETISSFYSINWVAGGGYVLSTPENILIATENDSTAVLTWDLVPGATAYKVYSSLDPYGTFAEDSTGTFTESRKWEKVIDGDKYFYYIIATDGTGKETKRILAPRGTEVR